MTEELLDRVVREIRERRQAARAAYDESRRLEQALAALGPPSPRTSANAGGSSAGRRARRRRSRAAPGANREAIVALVRERPGVTAGEIVAATGIARSTVTTTLARLVDSGALRRRKLPGGRAGFRARETRSDEGAGKRSEAESGAPASKAPPASG